MKTACLEVQDLYDQFNKKSNEDIWTADDYLDGLMGDIGDLHKLVMAKNNKRGYKAANHKNMTVDEAIAHELSDVIWSVVIIADKYKIDLEQSVLNNMKQLKAGIQQKLQS